MANKLNPRIELPRHREAFDIYRDLGHKRSLRQVSMKTGHSATSIGSWAKTFNWDERLKLHAVEIRNKKEDDIILTADDPIARKAVDVMDKMEAVIRSAFAYHEDGSITATVKVLNLEELTKFIAEYRRFLETYQRLAPMAPPGKNIPKKGTNIEGITFNFNDMPQEQRIEIAKGVIHGNDEGGNREPTGGGKETDLTKIPGRGDEDGPGRDGISGSPPGSDGGDKEAL